MNKQVEIFVRENVMKASENELQYLGRNGINLWYGFDNYSWSMEHVMNLRKAIQLDYPDIKDDAIFINKIQMHESNRHANQMMLNICVSIEDFLKLRKEDRVDVL